MEEGGMGKGAGPRGGEVEARGFVFAAPDCPFLVAACFPDAFLASPLRLFFIDGLFRRGHCGLFSGRFFSRHHQHSYDTHTEQRLECENRFFTGLLGASKLCDVIPVT